MWRSSYGLLQGQGNMECCGGRLGAGGCSMSAAHAPPGNLRYTVMEKIKIPYINSLVMKHYLSILTIHVSLYIPLLQIFFFA